VILLKNFKNMFLISELRRKLLFTLGIFVVYRLGVHIPAIGVNVPKLGEYMQQATLMGGLLKYLEIFSGGALTKATIFALGIMPYITASIMMQILGMSVPYLEQLLKEGEHGRKVINQYTRYVTLLLSAAYGFSFSVLLETQGLALTPGWGFRILFMLSLMVGTMFVMWLGEQISLHGIGNGSSMIIFAGIVAKFPEYAIRLWASVFETGVLYGWQALFVLGVFLAITACIVFVEKAERKIPVQYARRVVGNRVYGGQSTYIPFKINTASVMPVIFSGAVLNIPLALTSFLSTRYEMFRSLAEYIVPGGLIYTASEFLLIIFFSFFYTALIYNPEELAENIKKSGGFIPGIRPGKKTAEFFNYILTRIGLIGALYLAFLAIIPTVMSAYIKMPFYLGGTSLLIVVGVALETSAQIESYLIEHRYEGFLQSGRMKGRMIR